MFPRLVAADAEDGQVDALELVIGVGKGSIAGEKDFLRADGQNVAVVPPVTIPGRAGTPVLGLDGFDFEVFEDGGLVPIHFDDIGEAGRNQAAGSFGSDDERGGGAQPLEGGLVEMIEMRMADQDHIDWRQVLGLEGWIADAGETDGAFADFDADAPGENWVGEDVQVAEADQHRAVAEPTDDDVITRAFAFACPRFRKIGRAGRVIVKGAEIGELFCVAAHARTNGACPELEFGLVLPARTHDRRVLVTGWWRRERGVKRRGATC